MQQDLRNGKQDGQTARKGGVATIVVSHVTIMMICTIAKQATVNGEQDGRNTRSRGVAIEKALLAKKCLTLVHILALSLRLTTKFIRRHLTTGSVHRRLVMIARLALQSGELAGPTPKKIGVAAISPLHATLRRLHQLHRLATLFLMIVIRESRIGEIVGRWPSKHGVASTAASVVRVTRSTTIGVCLGSGHGWFRILRLSSS